MNFRGITPQSLKYFVGFVYILCNQYLKAFHYISSNFLYFVPFWYIFEFLVHLSYFDILWRILIYFQPFGIFLAFHYILAPYTNVKSKADQRSYATTYQSYAGLKVQVPQARHQPSRWLWEKKNPTLVHLIQTKVDLGSLGHSQCTFLLVHATTSFSRHVVNLCEPWAHSWVSNWAWVDYISSLIWTFE